MELQLRGVTEENFFDIINVKSETKLEKEYKIFESMVGSNAFFIAFASVKGWINQLYLKMKVQSEFTLPLVLKRQVRFLKPFLTSTFIA